MLQFLNSFSYHPPGTPPNLKLRQAVTSDILSWNAGLSQAIVDGITDTACGIAECSYPHLSYSHQLFIALYTAYLTYVDDLGQHNPDAVGQFVQRFTDGEPQLVPALDRLATLLGTVYKLYPYVCANGIVSNTLDVVTWMYVEFKTKGKMVLPAATRYLLYLRLRAGAAPAYAYFNFARDWAATEGVDLFYLQIIP